MSKNFSEQTSAPVYFNKPSALPETEGSRLAGDGIFLPRRSNNRLDGSEANVPVSETLDTGLNFAEPRLLGEDRTSLDIADTQLMVAADLGATHSRFAVFHLIQRADRDDCSTLPFSLKLIAQICLLTRSYENFGDMLDDLTDKAGASEGMANLSRIGMVKAAVLAPAGPVRGTSCRPTNIDFEIDARVFAKRTGFKTLMINDFVAQGYAGLMAHDPLLAKELQVIDLRQSLARGCEVAYTGYTHGQLDDRTHERCAIVGAGSGLGKAVILREQGEVLASEGAHSVFPFVGEEEFGYAGYLEQRLQKKEISAEDVVSGNGLAALYSYFSGEEKTPAEVTAIINDEENRRSLPQSSPLSATLVWFARFYGRVCKNFALDTLSLGGLFIAGGLALHAPLVHHHEFVASFEANQAQGNLLRQIPLLHIKNPYAGLFGAAGYGVLHSGL